MLHCDNMFYHINISRNLPRNYTKPLLCVRIDVKKLTHDKHLQEVLAHSHQVFVRINPGSRRGIGNVHGNRKTVP